MAGQGDKEVRHGSAHATRGGRQAAPRHGASRTTQRGSTHPVIRSPRPYDPTLATSAYYTPQRRGDHVGGARRRRRRGSVVPAIIALVVIVVMAGVGAYLFLDPPSYNVTINGTVHTVGRGTTIADVIESGLVTPAAGDLVAVDGSLITAGGGEAFAATVNGEPTTDATVTLTKGSVADITDGVDVTETYTAVNEAIPHGQRESDTGMYSYWNGSLHVYVKGHDGLRTTKTGDVSGIAVTEDVTPAVDSGYVIYTANVGEDKVCALTFDDGPWGDTTDEILDILQESGAKATFFTIGEQVAEHADQVRRAHDMGCEICTHTWDHARGAGQGVNLAYMSAEQQVAEVTRGLEAISAVIGEEPTHVMRAPGGNFYGDLIATLEPYLDAEVGWDVDTEDWRRPGSDAIYESIMGVQPGQVVLMHDGGGDRTQTVEAVRQAVPALVAQGYRLVTVSELLAYGIPEGA